ncbi:calpain-A [Aplysia californica]|uniref:Calpain-A n=1 Tax=Aplysia californica TaxID=6500 RepID=A0ABM0JZT6_APLCA|nr:calpain-A [Aplysia californica]
MGCSSSVQQGDEAERSREPSDKLSQSAYRERGEQRNGKANVTPKHNNNNNRHQDSFKEEDEGFEEEFSDGALGLTTEKGYEEICQSLSPNNLFEDPDFPANDSALYLDPKRYRDSKIEWMRPQEILGDGNEAELITNGVTRDDIKQGILGDCWFLSSCAAVSRRDQLVTKIIPANQVLSGPMYNGLIRFNFWRFGEWVMVVIDDRLPTVKKKLIYGQSKDPKEFWVALMEKAYAKLHGSYEALEGGITMDALVDLTGGLAERYELTEYDPSLYKLILRAHKSGAFIACSRKGDWRSSTKADANGLIPGHAYTVIDITKIKHKMGEEKLLRVRNPWGDETEWRGSWSDNDVNWKWVDEETKEKIQQESKDDGEFWMSFKDFYRQFGEVTICLMGPDFDGDGVSDRVGHMEMIHGEWSLGQSAGGSRNNLVKFATNDQYLLTLTEPDDFNQETDDAESEGKSTIVISLMQEHRRSRRNVKVKSYQIGFFIYKTEDTNNKLSLRHFRYNPDVARTNCFVNFREVSGRFELDPGHYVIIPSTFLEDCPAHYMLRVFGEKKFSLKGPLLPTHE